MASNEGVVYLGPGKVEVQSIDYPQFLNPQGKSIEHGVILKVVSTNICGSDQHMVRGRTTAPSGLVLGHEITGEIIEKGKDVEYLDLGDLVTVPFNIACGRCRTCRERQTGVCLNVNPGRAGGAYGYVDMGGWVGGQAKYVMAPYADFNLIKSPGLASGGSLGLLGVTLLERLVPILPSKALLVAIGIAVAGGHWSLPTALLTSTGGYRPATHPRGARQRPPGRRGRPGAVPPNHSLLQEYAEGKYCAQATSRCDINMIPESLPKLFQLKTARFSLEHLRDPSHRTSRRYRRYRRPLLHTARRLP